MEALPGVFAHSMQRKRSIVVDPQHVFAGGIAARFGYESSRGCRALFGSDGGKLTIADAGDAVIAASETEQCGRACHHCAALVEHEYARCELVNDHIGQPVVVLQRANGRDQIGRRRGVTLGTCRQRGGDSRGNECDLKYCRDCEMLGFLDCRLR